MRVFDTQFFKAGVGIRSHQCFKDKTGKIVDDSSEKHNAIGWKCTLCGEQWFVGMGAIRRRKWVVFQMVLDGYLLIEDEERL